VIDLSSDSKLSDQQELLTLKNKVRELEATLKQTQAKVDDLCVVQEVAQSLTSELKVEPLLHKILASAVQVMGAAAGSLLLLDDLTDELIFAVIEGGGGESLKGMRMPRDRGIAGWVATHRKPIIVDDVNQDDRYYQSVAQSFNFNLTSLLCVPMISHRKLIGVLQVLHSTPGCYFGESEQQLLTTFANQAAIAIENAQLYENLQEERDKLVVVEDEIRKRLARDLHDGPTQMLASIVMSLDFARKLMLHNPNDVINELNLAKQVAKKALKQLRTLLFDLRPVILETQGLIPALEVYAERLQETDNLNIRLTVKEEFPRLSTKAEVAIFAVVQEAVNNAKKYAKAAQVDLILQPDKKRDSLHVSIKDDGRGFDVPQMRSGYDLRGSLGMINMQERTTGINGIFRIQSETGQGTHVTLEIPLSENFLQERIDP
jgi:signal transduction histidine kinase